MREEATNVMKDFGIIIQNSEQVKQLSFLISQKFSYSLIVALNILLVFNDLVFMVSWVIPSNQFMLLLTHRGVHTAVRTD